MVTHNIFTQDVSSLDKGLLHDSTYMLLSTYKLSLVAYISPSMKLNQGDKEI
jgi:hypothetical protein